MRKREPLRAGRRERDALRPARATRVARRGDEETGRGYDDGAESEDRPPSCLACLLARPDGTVSRGTDEAMRENKARMDEAIADEMGNASRLLANLSLSSHPTPRGRGTN